MNDENLPDSLQSTYQLVKCAYPDGIPEDEYWALMLLVHPYMSHRALAKVLSVIMQKDYFYFLNDAMGFGADPPPDAEAVERVSQKLLACGYAAWVKENEF